MKHHASPRFWKSLRGLPKKVQKLARKNFKLLKKDPDHPSLHFKKVGDFYSARVGLNHRALATDGPDGPIWFWIGSHADYDKMLAV